MKLNIKFLHTYLLQNQPNNQEEDKTKDGNLSRDQFGFGRNIGGNYNTKNINRKINQKE